MDSVIRIQSTTITDNHLTEFDCRSIHRDRYGWARKRHQCPTLRRVQPFTGAPTTYSVVGYTSITA